MTNLPTTLLWGEEAIEEQHARPPVPRASDRVPADEHRDGGAAVRARDRRGGPDRRGDGLGSLLRDRNDRALDGLGGADGLGRGRLGGVDRVRARERRPERDRELGVLRGRGRARPSRSCATAPAIRTSSSSTRRGPASSNKAIRRLGRIGAPRIVYVSCNPTTLAGNVKLLRDDWGYELKRTRPVDMFPHTPHVESRLAAGAHGRKRHVRVTVTRTAARRAVSGPPRGQAAIGSSDGGTPGRVPVTVTETGRMWIRSVPASGAHASGRLDSAVWLADLAESSLTASSIRQREELTARGSSRMRSTATRSRRSSDALLGAGRGASMRSA